MRFKKCLKIHIYIIGGFNFMKAVFELFNKPNYMYLPIEASLKNFAFELPKYVFMRESLR